MTEAEELELLELEEEEAKQSGGGPRPAQAIAARPEPQPEPGQPGLLSRAADAVAKGAGDVVEMFPRTYAEDIPAMTVGTGDPTGEGPGGARLLKRAAAMASGLGEMGTLGHGDEIAAAFGTVKQRLGKPAVDWRDALRDKAPEPGLVDQYYANREQSEDLTQRMKEQEPGAYLGGEISALIPGALAKAPGAAASGAGRLWRALKAAVPQGGIFGAGSSEAKPLKGDVGRYIGDAAAGGAVAAGTAGALQGGGELATRGAGRLRNFAIDQGRRFLLSGADQLSKRAPVQAAAVEEALTSGAIRPFSSVEAAREKLTGLVDEQDVLRRSIIDELAARGVRGPRASAVADDLLRRGEALLPNTMDKALPMEFAVNANELVQKVGGAPTALGGMHAPSDLASIAAGVRANAARVGRKTLALPQAEQLKTSLQEKAKYGRVEDTTINEMRKEIASALRQANEDAIEAAVARAPPGSDTAKFGAQFVPVKQREGRLIEALKAAERGTARASQRQGGGVAQGLVSAAESAQALSEGMPGWAGYLKRLAGDGRMKSAEARGAYALANAMRNPNSLSRYAPEAARARLAMTSEDDNPEAVRMRALIGALRGE